MGRDAAPRPQVDTSQGLDMRSCLVEGLLSVGDFSDMVPAYSGACLLGVGCALACLGMVKMHAQHTSTFAGIPEQCFYN